jgi:predicted TPR repeat methyltransferase
LNPEHEEVQFLLAVCGANVQVNKIPPSLVEEQLDALGENYEKAFANNHLETNLAFKTMLHQHFGEAQGFEILVIPARSGIAGEILHDRANRIIGVESSLKLAGLARARKLNDRFVFNEVIARDGLQYLKNSMQKYDVVISDFFLPLFGDLAEILSLLRNALKPDGVLAISFDAANLNSDYALSKQSLGFVHSSEYINKIIKKSGLKIIDENRINNNIAMLLRASE